MTKKAENAVPVVKMERSFDGLRNVLFATRFARDNAQFSHSRFLEAAGYRT